MVVFFCGFEGLLEVVFLFEEFWFVLIRGLHEALGLEILFVDSS